MKTTDFRFNLPFALIAQEPSGSRGDDRLLVLERETGALRHLSMPDFPSLVPEGSVLVFNDSRVMRARLRAESRSGGSVEVLLVRKEGPALWKAITTRMSRQTEGKTLSLAEGLVAEVVDDRGHTRTLRFSYDFGEDYLERNGHLPLPPYIKREDSEVDASRYQTVYARENGSAAAPTAGLHFTESVMGELSARGAELRFVTLHVGLGTFMPVREERLEDHVMHEEYYTVPDDTAAAVNAAKREGRPVFAIGTTSVRTLESAWRGGGLAAGSGSTDIFIYPGYEFRVVDRVFTNFHTPESTLLMLVSAFAGRERVFAAYEEAVRMSYRFFSYGDAMLIQ